MFRQIALMMISALILVTTFSVFAQEDNASPTPAPSKTPSLTVPTATSVPTRTQSTGFEALTQADLSVLTANVQRPNGITWFNGKLYAACTGDGTVYEIDAATGQTRAYIFGVRNAQTLYAEADENDNLTLWVPDYVANTLSRVTRTSVEPVVSDLQGPWGIAYIDEQQFLVSNSHGNTVNLLSREGDNQVVLEGLSAPMGIAHDEQMLYVANYGSTRRSIEWYSLDAVVAGAEDDAENHVLVSGLQNTTGIQLGSDGNLYFAYALGNRGLVGRVNPQVCLENGGCTNEDVEIVLYSDLNVPLAGLTLSPDMEMFVHTMFVPDLYRAQIEG